MDEQNQDTKAPEQKKRSGGRHLSLADQLQRIEEQRKELTERARRVKAQINVRERRQRAHRLIELGAVVESVAGAAVTKNALPHIEAFLRAHRDALGAALEHAAREQGAE